ELPELGVCLEQRLEFRLGLPFEHGDLLYPGPAHAWDAGMQKRPGPCGTGRVVGKGRWRAPDAPPRERPRVLWPAATFPVESLDSVTVSSLLLGGSSTGWNPPLG